VGSPLSPYGVVHERTWCGLTCDIACMLVHGSTGHVLTVTKQQALEAAAKLVQVLPDAHPRLHYRLLTLCPAAY